MNEQQPTWQSSPCPKWCTRLHEEEDTEGDRDHMSVAIYVPVIRAVRHLDPTEPYSRDHVPDELVMAAFQGQDEPRPSISVGLAEDSRVVLELEDESAARLARELAGLIRHIGADNL